MKIFVGWPYDAEWVDKYVLPLIETYGVTVLTGKELQGIPVSQGVREKIAEADAALFIATRREGPDERGLYRTSEWVVDEIKHANSIKKEVVIEVREDGVDYANKIHEERQYIPLDPGDHIKALVEIGRTIGRWRGLSFKLKLLPTGPANAKAAFTDALLRRLSRKDYNCLYRIRQQGSITHRRESVEIVREGQDQFIYTSELPANFFNSPDAYLEVEVNMGGMQWSSPGIRFNAIEVPLEIWGSPQFNAQRLEVST